MMLLQVAHLRKTYTTRFGGSRVEALRDLSFSVESGEFVALMGESGSGKTTLLNLLSGMDQPSQGDIFLEGKGLAAMKEKELSAFRRENLGFVFQDFNLLDNFSLEDNIFLPLVLSGGKYQEMQRRLIPLVKQLGIADLMKKFPYEISGGQKQRVAIARAMITSPKILMADEPTGALDSRAADQILGIFDSINRSGQSILMVTHSIKAASCAGRVLFIKDGELFHQLYRGGMARNLFYQRISDALTVLSTGGEFHG